jgi:hypothetical protein
MRDWYLSHQREAKLPSPGDTRINSLINKTIDRRTLPAFRRLAKGTTADVIASSSGPTTFLIVRNVG